MKKKDLMYVFLAVGIIAVAGYLVMTQLVPKSSNKAADGVKVDKIGVISSDLNQDAITMLKDPTQVRDFAVPINLSVGLGNTAPFGQ